MAASIAGEVLILTGPPGAGKSTVAASLATDWACPAVHIHSDDFWHFIKQGRIAPYLPEARAQNGIVMDALTAATRSYAAGGYFAVVDGIVGPWFLGRFLEALRGMHVHYVVLRPDLAVVLQRARGRGREALADEGPISDLHRQFADLGGLEPHAIDTTRQSASETLEVLRAALRKGAFLLPRETPAQT